MMNTDAVLKMSCGGFHTTVAMIFFNKSIGGISKTALIIEMSLNYLNLV